MSDTDNKGRNVYIPKKKQNVFVPGGKRDQDAQEKRIVTAEQPALDAAPEPKNSTVILEEEPAAAAPEPKNSTVILEEEPAQAAPEPKQGTILLEEETVPAGKQGTIMLEEEAQGQHGTIFLEEDSPAGTPKVVASSQVMQGFGGRPQGGTPVFDDTERKQDEAFLRSKGFFRCLGCMQEYDTKHFNTCPYCGFVQGTDYVETQKHSLSLN